LNVNLVDVRGFRDQNKRDTLFIGALTEANAERMKSIPGITGVVREIAKETMIEFSLISISGMRIILDQFIFRKQEKQLL
jgi:hypothetical protein